MDGRQTGVLSVNTVVEKSNLVNLFITGCRRKKRARTLNSSRVRSTFVLFQCFCVAGAVESQARVLVPLKTHRVEELIHVQSVVAQSPPVGGVLKLGKWNVCLGVILIT
ncbi:hypothetical protein TNCV_1249651 [Trichonephila clavipes]|nr:hypothetical protein TNCV_1249651 [Trichonephila clavipes]